MRHAFLADVHGNYEALQAVLGEIEKLSPDRVLCLGDLVGYGADPERCVEEIRDRKIPALMGNHDAAACGKLGTEYFNAEAYQSILWTRERLSEQARLCLAQLPLTDDREPFAAAHGTLANPGAFDYILTAQDAEACFSAHQRRLAFVGHSHSPVTFLLNGHRVSATLDSVVRVPEGARGIVNVGSVGQPRDGNPMAAFALLDTATCTIEIRRVPYDIEAAAEKIVKAGLPILNAWRLYVGQ